MPALSKVLPFLKYFHLDDIEIDNDKIAIVGTAKKSSARCPLCGRRSRSIHSWYARIVADLPLGNTTVVLRLRVRRFFCRATSCPRRIFVERLPALVALHGRRSDGLRQALQQIGLRVGGEAGARLAHVLGMHTSPDSLLQLIRATPCATLPDAQIVGVDEWAWRKGTRYGTVLVDLTRHRLAALLPDRHADTTAAWFADRPHIEVVSRDRAGLYAEAAARGAPQATQVADRFHLSKNLGDALEKFLRHKGVHLKEAARAVAEAMTPPSDVYTPTDAMYRGKPKEPRPRLWEVRAEEDSLRRHSRRLEAYEAVVDLHARGIGAVEIARQVGVSRRTVHRSLRAGGPPERKRPGRRRGQPVLARYEDYLVQRWEEGCHNGRQLWREIQAKGYAHGQRTVARFVAELRHGGTPRQPVGTKRSPFASTRGPSARGTALLFLRRPGDRTPEQAAFVAHVCQLDMAIATAYALTQDFASMVRERRGERLDGWIELAEDSDSAELARFAHGLRDDHAAVQAGLTLAYSNGQVEGQILKIKLVRRSMYGRGKFDLLERRVLYAA